LAIAASTRTAGLLGGLGPESTIDYYRRILELWQEECPGSSPSLVIHSLDVDRGIDLVRNDRGGLVDYLLWSLDKLAGAGCDFAAMAANTPHIVFDELAPRSPLPLLSIVEVTAEEAAARALTRVGLLGTGFTMEAGFYPAVFGRLGIEVVAPDADDRSWLHAQYLGNFLKGVFTPQARDRVGLIIRRLVEEQGIEAVVLAGTELPLLLNAPAVAGVPLLDTTELHVRGIVRHLQQRKAPAENEVVPQQG
jgi:aspartate racemase